MADSKLLSASSPDTLVDFAYQQIRTDITQEVLKPGAKVVINDLCERYGISQTPIKQAMNRLMMQGLVENVPRKGYKVRRVTWNEIDEVFELRLMMELHFIKKVIDSVSSNTLLQHKFESNIKENMELVQSIDSIEDFFKAYAKDQEFHELLITAGGSQTAVRTYRSLNTHAYATYLYGKQPQEKTVKGICEHQSIYDSIRKGDYSDVKEQLTVHSENARKVVHLSLKLAKML